MVRAGISRMSKVDTDLRLACGSSRRGLGHLVGAAGLGVEHDQDFFHRFVVDRKSTRLNSSHVEISYAVFCLKKQNPSNPRLFRYCQNPPRSPASIPAWAPSLPSPR